MLRPFTANSPALAATIGTAASASAALPGTGNTLRIVNEGPNIAFLAVGTGTQTSTLPTGTATRTCTPLPLGETILTIPNDAVQNFSAICRATASAVLVLQVGEGQ